MLRRAQHDGYADGAGGTPTLRLGMAALPTGVDAEASSA
jgi:hypothetical protein